MNNLKTRDKTVKYLSDYQPSDFDIKRVDIDFSLFDNHSLVTTKVTYSKTNKLANNLELSGLGLDLLSVYLDGEVFTNYQHTNESLTLFDVPDYFVLSIQVRIHPETNTLLEGLYQSNHIFCTQCEPEGFRRITYFLDRPDVMTTYHVRIEANKKKYPVLLSNGNLLESGELENGRHYVKWHDPFKKPSYLFALVAGDLSVIEKSYQTKDNREVLLQVYTEKQYQNQSQYALDALERSMKWDEDTFNLIYDLDRYMIVSIDDFNMGAMENKGLNIFNSKYVLANVDTATDNDFLNIENIIGHEYFHNWTGNRVTCRDWFQLSLKEGLTVFRDALFSADMTTKGIKRLAEVKTVRNHQFIEDTGPTSHPVRPDSYIEMNNFYTLTIYEKGAEIIRMMYNLIGREKFKQGIALYFKRHDGQAVTIEDFAKAMSDASGFDFMGQFFNWYTQSGVPTVHVETQYNSDTKVFSINLSQDYSVMTDHADRNPVIIPVSYQLFDEQGEAISSENQIVLNEKHKMIEFGSIQSEPVLSILRNFSAPVYLNYQQSDQHLHVILKNDDDLFTRFNAQQSLVKQLVQTKLERLPSLKDALLSFVDTMRFILNSETPIAEKAELLTLPSYSVIFEMIPGVDLDELISAIKFIYLSIAEKLKLDFLHVVESELQFLEDDLSFKAMSERKLRSVAWQWLSQLMSEKHDEVLARLAYQQFVVSKGMTLKLATLSALNDIDCEERKVAFESFYEQFNHLPQVMDKWLSLQAQRDTDTVNQDIVRLSKSPVFSIKNPNKVRALFGGFAMGNFVQFHHKSGRGYQLLTELLIGLDEINPSTTANMVKPLIHWKKFDSERQKMMCQCLEQLYTKKNLSKDLYEIVSQAKA